MPQVTSGDFKIDWDTILLVYEDYNTNASLCQKRQFRFYSWVMSKKEFRIGFGSGQ